MGVDRTIRERRFQARRKRCAKRLPFPAAPDLASFSRLLESGGNSITENTPGSGVGRVSEIFAGGVVPSEACRFGADPTLPHPYLPTLDPSEVFAVGYDFLPDATHFLLLEQPKECVRVMREFLEPILRP